MGIERELQICNSRLETIAPINTIMKPVEEADIEILGLELFNQFRA